MGEIVEMTDTGEMVQIETGVQPQHAIIWLHGLGADGYDFVPIVKELEQLGLPPTRFLFPHATKIPVGINNGCVMRAWYDIKNVDFQREEDETGIRKSQARIESLIETLIENGIASTRIVLAGFSQGGAITYQTGLRCKHKLAGLMVLSGYLTCEDSFELERTELNFQTPILICHGKQDNVVLVSRAERAAQLLKKNGYSAQWKTYAMAHSVCDEEIRDISNFLKQVLI